MAGFHATPEEALVALEQRVDGLLPRLDQVCEQGDERGRPVNFFRLVRATEKLNPDFVRLASDERYSPARQIIEPMMRWNEDADGNFVEQFQTTDTIWLGNGSVLLLLSQTDLDSRSRSSCAAVGGCKRSR